MKEEIEWYPIKVKPKARGWYLVKTSKGKVGLDPYSDAPSPSWWDDVVYWANLPKGPAKDEDE